MKKLMNKILIGFILIMLAGCITLPLFEDEQSVKLNILTTDANDLPITTWEQATNLAIEKFGSEEILNCDEENMVPSITRSLDIPLDPYGYYGYRVTKLIDNKKEIIGFSLNYECIIKTGNKGVTVLDFRFDPNNAWVKDLVCNKDIYDNCPKDETGEYINFRNNSASNPDYETYLELI